MGDTLSGVLLVGYDQATARSTYQRAGRRWSSMASECPPSLGGSGGGRHRGARGGLEGFLHRQGSAASRGADHQDFLPG